MYEKVVALTIAGSDSGAGAGIQADLKTFSALGIYGTSVITAITAQNLDGVYAIQGVDPDIVKKQLIAVLKGFPVRAIKTGMLYSREIIEIIAHYLNDYKKIPLIIDPVFISTSGY
jgi:hydroxymethylpyrimidine/phosphomethylpyrimidine kinase